MTTGSAEAQHLRDLAWLRRVRDRIDREYDQPLDVEALARGAHMSAGHLSRQFKFAYGESPYRDTLGFDVRGDAGYGGMRWITVGPAAQPETSVVLYPPTATPGLTDDERATIAEMMARGTFASINLAAPDLAGNLLRIQQLA